MPHEPLPLLTHFPVYSPNQSKSRDLARKGGWWGISRCDNKVEQSLSRLHRQRDAPANQLEYWRKRSSLRSAYLIMFTWSVSRIAEALSIVPWDFSRHHQVLYLRFNSDMGIRSWKGSNDSHSVVGCTSLTRGSSSRLNRTPKQIIIAVSRHVVVLSSTGIRRVSQ